MSEFLQEHVKPIFDELSNIAQTHADLSPGLLTKLPYDISTYSVRDLLKHSIKGAPIDPVTANMVASSVDERYESLYRATEECPEISLIEEALLSGQGVVLAMNHGELIDAALQPLAIANAIKIKNPELKDKDGQFFFRTGLIVSRMVEFLGVKGSNGEVPVTTLFGMGFDRTYMTVPSTISTKGRFDKGATRIYNERVTGEIAASFERRARSNKRPMLLAVAAPGTVDKPLDIPTYNRILKPLEPIDEARDVIVVGQISYRIVDFTKNALTYAAIARLDKQESDVRIDGRHLSVRSDEDVEELAQKLISLLQARDPDIDYMYDKDGDLPVIRKKS